MMLKFDFVIFILAVGMLCGIIATQPHTSTVNQMTKLVNAREDDWQVKQTFYCCQFIYGLFSWVFVPFKIPFLQAVLTHSVPTAYDEKGRCCKFRGPEPPPEDEESKIQWIGRLMLGTEQVERFTAHLKTAMAGGKITMDELRSRVSGMTPRPESSDEEGRQVVATEDPKEQRNASSKDPPPPGGEVNCFGMRSVVPF